VRWASLEWPDEDLPAAVSRLEEMLIRRAIDRSSRNRAEAAGILNILVNSFTPNSNAKDSNNPTMMRRSDEEIRRLTNEF
jgi:hypothetical protein